MDRKLLFVGIGSVILIGIVVTAVLFFGKPDTLRGTTYTEPYPIAPDFELTRADGSNFQLSGMRGKIVLLFYGYTSCSDVCPTTMANLRQAVSQLSTDDAENVQVVFVTVDPARDTPQVTQDYANHFDPSFIGLSGSQDELTKIWNDYGVFVQIIDTGSAAGYGVDHTARVLLIDQQGDMRVSYGFDTPFEDLAHDIQLILKEGG